MSKTRALALEVKHLTKEFAGKTLLKAVDNLSFGLKQGEILGLLGPNGAGKTTTIQMLLSILTPTSGEINYFGQKFFTSQFSQGRSPRLLKANFTKYRSSILQNVAFASTYIEFPWRMSVQENLDVYGRLYGLSRKQIQGRSLRLLDFFGIANKCKSTVSQLSAGQKTRVMLAKAFLAYPKVVLLDEPTASLDPDIAIQVREFVKQQRDEYGVSVLFTSHNMTEVAEVCDRVMFLSQGKIIANDKPAKLVAQIKGTNLRLNVGDGLKRTQEICEQQQFAYQIDSTNHRLITISLEERQIASLLNQLAQKGVDYHEIDILKPNLEDYFLKVATMSNSAGTKKTAGTENSAKKKAPASDK